MNVSKLVNINTLNLNRTNVTDKSVSKLINADRSDLSWTKITDNSVSKLVNAHILYINGTNVMVMCTQIS